MARGSKVQLCRSSVVKSSNVLKISCPEDQICGVQLSNVQMSSSQNIRFSILIELNTSCRRRNPKFHLSNSMWFIFHFSIDIIPLLCVPFFTLHPKENWKTWKIWGRISNILGYCENISLKWWSSELAVDIIIEQLNAVMLMMQLQLSQVEVWKWIVGHKSSFGH